MAFGRGGHLVCVPEISLGSAQTGSHLNQWVSVGETEAEFVGKSCSGQEQHRQGQEGGDRPRSLSSAE